MYPFLVDQSDPLSSSKNSKMTEYLPDYFRATEKNDSYSNGHDNNSKTLSRGFYQIFAPLEELQEFHDDRVEHHLQELHATRKLLILSSPLL